MDDLNKIAYCGLYCGACKLFLSTQNNTLSQLSQTTGIPIDLLQCTGCRSNQTSIYCRSCVLKKCSIKKGHFSCADCNEFPCSALDAFNSDQHKHHHGVIDSLKQLHELGNEQWLQVQTNRWSCKTCNTTFSWYDKSCANCNEKVEGL